MASLKDVQLQIVGVNKTKQITKAMNMVASVKLRGAQQKIERFRPYAEKFYEMLADMAGKSDASVHPLLEERAEVKKTGILLVTSERGLCGSFNANLISTANKLAKRKIAEGKEVVFYCAGRKGAEAIRKMSFTIKHNLSGVMGSFDFQLANHVAQLVIDDYLDGTLDEVVVVYGELVSLAKQRPLVLPLLPIQSESAGQTEATNAGSVQKEYIYEPNVVQLLGELLPRFIKVQIYRGLLDTSASEHAARMTAMDNATRNCDDLARDLTRIYNKTRQAVITTDLMDIVSGAEALKG